MKALGSVCLLAAILTLPAAADEKTARLKESVNATGVWYGAYVASPSYFSGDRRSAFSPPLPTFYVLSLEAQGSGHLIGWFFSRGLPSTWTQLDERAAASLGVGLARFFEVLQRDEITGALDGDKIAIETLPAELTTVAYGSSIRIVPNRRQPITGDGRIKDDQMRLTLVDQRNVAHQVVLQRCVVSEGDTVAQACSAENLWLPAAERYARRNTGPKITGSSVRLPRDDMGPAPQMLD